MASDYNIKEYPTIILVINDKRYVYDANLSELTLYKFLEAVTNSL